MHTQSRVTPFIARSTFGAGMNTGFQPWNNGSWWFRNRFGFPFRGFGACWNCGLGFSSCWNCGFGFGACWNCGFGFRTCWNCGFGFGGFGWWPGWGFGWPSLSFWNNWGDPWWWDTPGPGYFGYASNYNVYNYNGTYDNSSTSAVPAESHPNTDQNAPSLQPSPDAAASGDKFAGAVVLYLKDGTVYRAKDYWLSGGKLHFTVDNGVESWVEIDRLDMQRTVDENTRRGLQFILKPGPAGSSPLPDANGPSPNGVTDSNPLAIDFAN
jgi:hypothetical protein